MSSRARYPRRALRHRLELAVPFAVLVAAEQVEAAPLFTPPLSEAQSVVLSPPQCKADSFQLVPFLDSLRVELAGRGVYCCTLANPGDGMPTAAALRVKVEIVPCTADADRLQVSAHAPSDSRVVEREISLADVAATARPRALALAVAELIRSLEQGVGGKTPEAIAVSSKAPFPSPTPSPSGALRPVALSIHVEAETRGYPTRDTTMWGGRARFTAHRRPLHVDLDLGANYARARGELGVVLLRSASAGLGLGPRFATRTVIADLGLRAEIGWAWIRGEPAFADVRTGAGSDLISNVGFRLSLEAPAQVKIRPSLTLETGGVIRGMKAEVSGQPVAGMTGYYLLAALGIAVSL
jgi:hypothetical protein